MRSTYSVVLTAFFYITLHSASLANMLPPDASWTAVESWAWEQIQMGKEIQLPGPCPNPANGETDTTFDANPSSFSLRGAFLQQILTEPPYRDITTMKPLVIRGARVVGDMLADGGTSRSRVIVSCSTFDGVVLFNDWEFLNRVHFHKVAAKESIRIRDVDFKSRFTISNSDVQSISIAESRINGSLSFSNTHVRKSMNVINTRVENSLKMGCSEAESEGEYCATYGSTHFINLSVGRSIHLVGSQFNGRTIFETVELAGNFIADRVRYSGMLIFIGGTVDGRIYMKNSSSTSVLSLIGTIVLGGLDLSGGRHGTVKILETDIHRDLDLSKADIAFFLDITGTRVHGPLRLEPLSQREQARADSANRGFRRHFTARNAHVRILEDTKDAWDRWSVLDLSGFVYDKLSSSGKSVRQRADNPYLRSEQWFKNWLGKMETYSPQPYIQVSTLLRKEGQIGTANAILFEGMERERTALSWGQGRRWWLELLRHSIGYGVGLRAFCALGWMTLFAAIGWLLLTRRAITKDGETATLMNRLWYSITFTVPGLSLVSKDELTVARWAQSCLYFQRLVCFTLALLAGAAAIGIVRP